MTLTQRDIAKRYLEYFCSGDIPGLETLLAPDLKFVGPFHVFHSKAGYLKCLQDDPPDTCRYKVLSVTENSDSVAVFYEYQKRDQTVVIAQLFKIRDQFIYETRLVFDSRGI